MAGGVRISLDGAREFRARFDRLARANVVTRELAGTLYRRGENIMGLSKRLVPVETSNLKNSGHVPPPDIRGATVSVEMVYGGTSAPYAFIVHENLTARHTVGQAKYLEAPFLAEQRGTLDELRSEVRALLRFRRANRGFIR